jgi:hypothetical protein
MRPSPRGDGRNLDCVSLRAESASSAASNAAGFKTRARPSSRRWMRPASCTEKCGGQSLARPAGPHLNTRTRSPLEARIFSVRAISASVDGNTVSDGVEVTSSRPGVKLTSLSSAASPEVCALPSPEGSGQVAKRVVDSRRKEYPVCSDRRHCNAPTTGGRARTSTHANDEVGRLRNLA